MKGGCEIGKKSGQGGCKTGKKKKKGPATKPKTEATKLKGLKVKLEGKKKELVKLQEMKRSRDEAKPKPKIKFKVVKKEVKKPVKKKIKFKIKPAELPELKAITGLTKAQANKLEPAVLFGMLPKELAKDIVLNPKATGVKVGKNPRKKVTLQRYNGDVFIDSEKTNGFFEVYNKRVGGEWIGLASKYRRKDKIVLFKFKASDYMSGQRFVKGTAYGYDYGIEKYGPTDLERGVKAKYFA